MITREDYYKHLPSVWLKMSPHIRTRTSVVFMDWRHRSRLYAMVTCNPTSIQLGQRRGWLTEVNRVDDALWTATPSPDVLFFGRGVAMTLNQQATVQTIVTFLQGRELDTPLHESEPRFLNNLIPYLGFTPIAPYLRSQWCLFSGTLVAWDAFTEGVAK